MCAEGRGMSPSVGEVVHLCGVAVRQSASLGSTSIHLSADSLQRKGRAATNEWAVAIGLRCE
eukprot:8173316-Alexandrium_andersonii.AAC.1